jgi:two-component system LytT family response regulator
MPFARYTALLVDDEPAASQRLSQLLSEHPMIRVIGSMKSVAEARAFLDREGVPVPDLIFLDVEMPGGSGMELLPFVSEATRVIFVTAYAEHAALAFECDALDYLVKPVETTRLEKTVERFMGKRGHAYGSDISEGPALLTTVPEGNESHLIPPGSIRWIEGMQNYTRVRMTAREVPVILRQSLAEWEAILPEGEFHRIGRSHIIRHTSLQRTKWVSRDETQLFFEGIPEPLVVGRSAAARLKELLQNG